jgi:hypothetical protein
MDLKRADELLKCDSKVKYKDNFYRIKEIVIWYDLHRQRRSSFILYLNDKPKTTLRVDIKDCEEC